MRPDLIKASFTGSPRRYLSCYCSSYSDLREAMSIEKRYFTSDLSSLS